MKSLLEIFPRASKSTLEANPHLLPPKPKKTNPNATRDAIRAILEYDETPINSEIQDSKSERHQTAALGGTIQGKEECSGRVTVRFIGHRVRPLDPDNFAGGCKDLLDALRHSGLIHGDEPWRIIFETEQIKVNHRSEERTQIILDYTE